MLPCDTCEPAPGGPGRSRRYDGSVGFIEHEGEAVAEYDSYEPGFRLLGEAGVDDAKQLEDGRSRIFSKPEHRGALLAILPVLRSACHTAIEEAEEKFDLELPKYL